MQLNQSFVVSEVREFREGTLLVAKYQPGYHYRVTERNKAFVEALEAEGIASAPARGPVANTKGAVSTEPPAAEPARKPRASKKKG